MDLVAELRERPGIGSNARDVLPKTFLKGKFACDKPRGNRLAAARPELQESLAFFEPLPDFDGPPGGRLRGVE
ncbi:hypothetical protein [Streptomyces sp. NPDC007264]|uniref:hypothetical protein n=1 Tax=Streptomyces sp. NPDC007264 TaxID=3364777 RepID=UPI0036DEC55C